MFELVTNYYIWSLRVLLLGAPFVEELDLRFHKHAISLKTQ